jgi:hypothetical protein
VLERGPIRTYKDYPTAFKILGTLNKAHLTQKGIKERPIQSSHCNAGDKHYVKDSEHPCVQIKPFKWIRGYQVGGRSLTWGSKLSILRFRGSK